MRIAAIAVACCLSIVSMAAVPEASASVRTPTNISAQLLVPALKQLTKERNIQLIFRSEAVGDIRTDGASGDLTLPEALDQLLKGTGLTYEFLDERTVTIRALVAPHSPAPVPVTGGSSTPTADTSNRPEDWIRVAQDTGSTDSRAGQPNPPASEQNGAPANPSSGSLEEVVVTAVKQERNLQKVSQAIEVKQGEELREEGKQRIDEIMQGVVGVQAQDNRLGYTFFVRGVDASAGFPGQIVASPVAILIDGVTEPRSEIVRGDTLDLSQAEILKGPQSTLLGPNALSGAVNLTTNSPVLNQYQASGSLDVGDYAKRAFQGVLNLPLGSTTALRVAYSSVKRDGYMSSGSGDSDLSTIRAKFRWQASDNIDTVLTVERHEIGGNGRTQNVLLAYGYWSPVTAANEGGLNLSSTGCGSLNPTIQVSGCPAQYYNVIGAGPSFRQRPDAWNDGFPYNAFPNGPFLDTIVNKISERVDWSLPFGTLTVLPALEYTDFADREPAQDCCYATYREKELTPSVDVHMNSASDHALTWLVGAYYMRDKTYDSWQSFRVYPGSSFPAFLLPPSCQPPLGSPALSCFMWNETPLLLNTDASAYLNLSYSLNPQFRLSAGGRVTHDTAKMSSCAQITGDDNNPDPVQAAAAPCNTGSYGWRHGSLRAGVEYDVEPDVMVYANVSTGYTPGNFGVAAPDAGPPGFNPITANPATTLDQIAFGWKSELFDRHLRLNGEFFYTTFFNRAVQGQVSAYINGANSLNCMPPFPPPPGAFSVAQGSAGYCMFVGQDQAVEPKFSSRGLDLDAEWLITPDDHLQATFEYLKAEYLEAPTVNNGCDTVACVQALSPGISLADATTLSQSISSSLQAFSGAPPQNSPTTSATLNYSHTFHLPGGSELSPRIAAQYKSRYWSFGGAPGANLSQILADSHNSNDLAWQQSYTIWDAYLDWRSGDHKYSLDVYVKNLRNEVVLTDYTYPYVELAPPRTAGIILNAHL